MSDTEARAKLAYYIDLATEHNDRLLEAHRILEAIVDSEYAEPRLLRRIKAWLKKPEPDSG